MKTPFSSTSKFIWIASLTLAGIGGFTLRVLNTDYFAPADTCEEVVRYMSGCSLSCSDSGPIGRYSCEKSIINSYLGFMKHYKTYKIRKKMLTKFLPDEFWKYFAVNSNYTKIEIKPIIPSLPRDETK